MIQHEIRPALKFALMCNSAVLQNWQREVLSMLISSGKAELVLVIMPSNNSVSELSFATKVSHYPWRRLLFRKYYQYLFKPENLRSVAAYDLMGNCDKLHCTTILQGKYSHHFTPEDIKAIQAYHPDFILKFGFGIIRGTVLDCVPYGVWSFHHGDEQKYRGIPPAFHEILNNNPVTASILQRLTDRLDGGIILRKGYFPTIFHSWSANLNQAIELSKRWPLDVCHEILAQHTFPSSPTDVGIARILHEPENLTFSGFLIKLASNKIMFHLFSLFRAEKWSTGTVKARSAELLAEIGYSIDHDDIEWLKPRERHRYFADGFILKHQNRHLLLFEDYSYKQRKGIISTSWFNERENTFSEVLPAIIEKWHLSYPFVFRHENQIYCMPESLEHGSVELYRFDSVTASLHHYCTLLNNQAVADPTLVFHQNHWYLFCTPAHATNVELLVWHSETLEGPFLPHEMNPVKSDIGNARPAGPLFSLDGKLYRPAQDCSHTYGGRIIINEVKLLTDDSFLEMPVTTLLPPRGFDGIHTLSFAGDYMYFDCKKHIFIPEAFWWQLKNKLGLIHKRRK